MSSKKSASKITTRTAAHVHTNIVTLPYNHGYSGPVVERNSAAWNPAAHGKDCIVEVCACHAVRRTNVNGDEIETGEWHADPDTASLNLQLQAAGKIRDVAAQLATEVEGESDTTGARRMLAQALADLDAAVMIAARPQATAAA